MEMLSGYVVAIIVAICYSVGYIVKNSLDFIPNKYIPLIMATLGVIINVWINKGSFSPEILLSGLASGLASTGVFEAYKNIRDKE